MITQFDGKYSWLSNFELCAVTYNGTLYPSVEHAYMSAKSTAADWRAFCADPGNTPGKVKRRSRKIELRDGWEEMKVGVMRELLARKFSQRKYRYLLLATGRQTIREGNTWGDTFWGVDLVTGAGQNQLGKLLMEQREISRKKCWTGELLVARLSAWLNGLR